MVVRSSLYAVRIDFFDPASNEIRCDFANSVRPAFIPDNAVISCIHGPLFLEFISCPSGQQPFFDEYVT